jgi:hypothetical protein
MTALPLGLMMIVAASPEWESLFDGKTSAGWRTQTKSEFPEHAWKVEDGCLRSVATAPRVDLSTARSFRNFELEFDWKLDEGTNSGVKYLVFGVRPNPATGKLDPDVPKALGFELQLADDQRVDDAKSTPTNSTGALYLYVAPHDVPILKVGQWHKARIVVDGTHLEHWLDGVRVMEVDLRSAALREAMGKSARRDVPKPGDLDMLLQEPAKAFPLVLTHHGGTAWFRNLRIREKRP